MALKFLQFFLDKLILLHFMPWFPPNALYTAPTFIFLYRKSCWQVISSNSVHNPQQDYYRWMCDGVLDSWWNNIIQDINLHTHTVREDNCIWFNNSNLLKQAHYLAYNLQLEFNVSFSLSSLFLFLATYFFSFSCPHPCPLSICLCEIMDKQQKPEIPSLLQFERRLHASNTPSALCSIISDF